jgi:Mg2+/Co2+ transporter CorB
MSFEEVEKELAEHKEDFCPWFVNDYTQVKDQLKKYSK